ncbi:hypothetical protein SCA6_016723 [Theobroma cacao]
MHICSVDAQQLGPSSSKGGRSLLIYHNRKSYSKNPSSLGSAVAVEMQDNDHSKNSQNGY